ncbi:MAG: PLP-dependent aminotransferase family protein [Janthinobacterium lividum]
MQNSGQIRLDRQQKRSLQVQLADQLKGIIQNGQLRTGERLPSSRALADELQISRNTVVAAYEMLQGEGYVQGQERSAFVVGFATDAFRSTPRPRRQQTGTQRTKPQSPIAPVPFRPAQPDVSLFSLKVWNRHRTRVLKRGSTLLQYQSRFALGLDELRVALAGYLRDSRGVRCNWQQIAITSGSQQALFLLGHMLLDKDRSVYMEDPGYPGARRSWEQARARIVSVPVDSEGIRLPLPDVPDASLVYVTPSHQFPTGYCMSLSRRLELLRAAQARRLWIVEDDYDAEFRYTSAPQPSLQSLDAHGRVIYVGSFSKVLFPGLRLGYAVLPPELVDPFTALKTTVDDHGPLLDQATLTGFLESGAFYAHLRRCRITYRQRQELFLDLVHQKGLPFTFPVRGRGMNLAGLLDVSVDDYLLSEALQRHGLDTPPISGYCNDAVLSGLLFGLTAYDDTAIKLGVEKMTSALQC